MISPQTSIMVTVAGTVSFGNTSQRPFFQSFVLALDQSTRPSASSLRPLPPSR